MVARIARIAAIIVAALLALAALVYFGLNTDPGRRFVVRQINALEFASGLDIDIGRIDGSLYGRMVLRDLRVGDARGTFLAAPVAEVDWRPFAYLRSHVDIRSLMVPSATLARLPELKPGDPNAPTLPDLDIDIGRLELRRLQVGRAITGRRHIVALTGRAAIADGRAQVTADAATVAAPGIPGGDRLALRLDAVPDGDRFDISARVRGPADGLIAGLAGLDRPVAADIGGAGRWSDWRGSARASLGGAGIANLAVTARDGTFRITGPLRPALLLAEGSAQRLVQPLVQLDATVQTLEERRLNLDVRLNSPALAVGAQGVVDLGRSSFAGMKVAGRLLRPGAILPNLNGRDVRIALVVDGPFRTPVVAYDLQAAALGFNETVVEQLRAQGRARIDTERILIPVSARAARIGGLNPAVGGLLTNVAIDGSFAISGPAVLSDNLRIRSDRIRATAIVVADLAKGSYRAGLQGRIDNYLIQGVGLLDIDSDFDLVSKPNGGFGLAGRVAFRTRRIDNASARDFLGGNAVGSARIAVDENARVTISGVRLTAPQFRVLDGGGTYEPGGRLNLRATAVSTAYGRLALVVTGTVDRPQVDLRAANPGFGVGLRDIVARLRATARGYAITATGQSQYGPFSADVEILSGRGPLTILVNRVTFAGIDFAGRIVQTAAGPYAGTLTLAGSGLSGIVTLSANGRYQQAVITARANGARIPGEPPISIQRAIVNATAILYPDAPSIVGDAQVAGLRRDQTLVEAARVRINYRGGRGQAALVANGRSGVPFRIAANAALSPDLYRVAARGEVNRLAFRLDRPAEISRNRGAWRLAPATIVLPQGNVRIAGSYGDGLVLQSRFANLDLAIANAFSPTLGLGGKATGSLDFAQPTGASFPRADARLRIGGFTRAGVATLSAPVDISFAGALRPEGGNAAAIIRRGTAVIGRMQARLQPLSPDAGNWSTRLLASPLAGGIRYNGPAEVLWSLTGIAGQQLSGPVAIAADFSGRVQNPQFTGVVRANALTFDDETFGTRITAIALNGRFDRSRLEITQLSGRAGDGTITGRGSVGLASDAGFPIDVRVALQNARLARSDAIAATVSGDIAITNGPNQPALISGRLQLPEVRYQIIRQGGAEVAQLTGVRRKGEPLPRSGAEPADAGVPSIWNLDIAVTAPNEVFVSGMGLEAEFGIDLRVTGTSSTPIVTGGTDLVRGTYGFAGNSFALSRADVRFTGSRPINPTVAIEASADVEDVTINLNVSGTAYNPRIAFSSSPALPQDEIMARLLFGSSVTELSALQVVQLGASLNSLRGGGGGLNPLGMLRSATGIDRLRILGADEATGRGTALAAGFYVGDKIYVEVITDARGFTATQLEIALSKTLSLLSQAGSFGGSSGAIRYKRQY